MSEIPKNTPAILFKNVGFNYPGNIVALKNIDLKIDKGEKVGIIGPNGSGKSTLLNLLNGSYHGSGEIFINGIGISKKTDKQIKSMVGLVFQNPDDQLFCPTIFEDVAFGPVNFGLREEDLAERVTESLKEVGLEGHEDRSSDYLSFGEKKLASIASIISMRPDIVAMDEPVSNLDHAHRRKIINWIKKSERTIVVTSHDLEMLLDVCNRVILLNEGIKVADGNIIEILRNQELLHENNLEMPISLYNKSEIISKLEI
ncbi:MAG: ABC transporter ATP-binding protein [Calditrichaceae bacterium]